MARGLRHRKKGTGKKMDLAKFDAFRVARVAGDEKLAKKLRDQLVEENMPLVGNFVAKWASRTESDADIKDLVQAGAIGLSHAFEKYNPVHVSGAQFSTYATYWIRHEVQQAALKEPAVYMPREAGIPYSKRREEEAFFAKNGRDPNAGELGVSATDFEQHHSVPSFTSIDTSAHACADAVSGAEGPSLHNVLPDGREGVDVQMVGEENAARLRQAIRTLLTPCERRIVTALFFREENYDTVAAREQKSKEYIRQVRAGALEKLRNALA